MIDPIVADYLGYNPETGELHWKVRVAFRINPGTRAACLNDEGYLSLRVRGRRYLAHRVAWFLHTGEQPPALIDHKNTIRSDNRWNNLRAANKAQNGQNTGRRRAELPKGVVKHKCGRYQAQIRAFGKSHYLGLFETVEAAASAYASAASRLHGEFARTA
jgi:hypothetical protein